MSTTVISAPPPVLTPADPGTRRADIQGLRAAAVIVVVLFHAGAGLSGGFVGVDVFFVVSGFVISGMLRREIDSTGRIRFTSFYRRRARRLLPALAVVSVTTLVAAALLLSPLSGAQQATGMAGIAASVFAANGYFLTGGYFNPVAEGNPFLHLWSLSAEEQFYLVFPLLLLFTVFLARMFRERWARLVLAAVMAVSFGACVCFTCGRLPNVPAMAPFLNNPQLAVNFGYFTPLTRGWEFLSGALPAVLLARHRPSSRLATLAGALGAVLLAVTVCRLTPDDLFPGWLALAPVLATVLLLTAGSGHARARLNVVPRLLSWRPVARLGDASYSWYLWHWPLIVLARAAFPHVPGISLIAGVASLGPAIASYRFVERPFHYGRRMVSARATAALITGCLVVPLALGFGLRTAAQDGWGQARITAVQAVVRPEHLDIASGCESRAPLGSPRRPACLWTVPNARGTVLLIGDSNAGQLAEPFLGAARSDHLDATLASNGGCPFLVLPHYFTKSCQAYVEGSLESILTRRPAYDAVVISNATVGYVNGPEAPNLIPGRPVKGNGIQPQAIAGWARALDRTLQQVSIRSPVILIGSIPQHKDFPGCLAPTIFTKATLDCGKMSAEASGRQRDGVVDADRTAIARVRGRYLDTASRLCGPAAGCSVMYHHVLAYRDGAHLSVAGSYVFQDDLRMALASVLPASRDNGSVPNR
jgi:peptidoglycan/LPS O-acetylase OafA/YrhL